MADETKLGEAYVEVVARLDKLDRDLKQAQRSTETATRGMQNALSQLNGGIGKLSSAFTALKTAAVTTAVVGLFELGRRSIDAADRLDELSQKTGFGVERFQSLSLAARRSGIDVESMGQALAFFS